MMVCAFCQGRRYVRTRVRLGVHIDVCDFCMRLAGAGPGASRVYVPNDQGPGEDFLRWSPQREQPQDWQVRGALEFDSDETYERKERWRKQRKAQHADRYRPQSITAEQARLVPCRRCGAEVGEQCTSAAGISTEGCHRERYNTAAATRRNGM